MQWPTVLALVIGCPMVAAFIQDQVEPLPFGTYYGYGRSTDEDFVSGDIVFGNSIPYFGDQVSIAASDENGRVRFNDFNSDSWQVPSPPTVSKHVYAYAGDVSAGSSASDMGLFWRLIDGTGNADAVILCRVRNLLNSVSRLAADATFDHTVLAVFTWSERSCYNCPTNTDTVNFQVIFFSDGTTTYFIHIFGQLGWPTDGGVGDIVKVGYDRGNGANSFLFPSTSTAAQLRGLSGSTNVGSPGIFVYDVSGTTISTPPSITASAPLTCDTLPVDECFTDDPCLSGSTCTDPDHLSLGSTLTCACDSGNPFFTGSAAHCDDDIDDCATRSPCLNGAACENLFGSFRCTCAGGYTGSFCETAPCIVNPCTAANPCAADATCCIDEQTVEAYCVGGTTEGQACQTCDSLNTTEPMCCKYGFCFAIGTKLVSTNCVKYCECTRKKEGKPLKWKCGKIKGKHALKDDCPACAIDSAASAACDSVRFLETCGLLDCLSAAHKKFCGKGVPTCEGPAFPNAEAVLAPKDHKAVTTSCSALC